MNKSPLWMPEGSVRGILALILIGSTAALIFLSVEVPEGLWTLDAAIAALYFEHRRNGNG